MIFEQFKQIQQEFNRKVGQLESLKERKASLDQKVIELTVNEEHLAKASLFLQSLSDVTRVQVLEKISGIVTDALQTVKDKNLVFQMNLTTRASQPVLDMNVLDKTSGQVFDVLTSLGGGVADLISITLRIALLCRWTPSLTRCILMDEAGKFISVKDQEVFSEFIRKLSEALNLQLIWISHSDVLTAQGHKVFQITKENGISKVEEKSHEME